MFKLKVGLLKPRWWFKTLLQKYLISFQSTWLLKRQLPMMSFASWLFQTMPLRHCSTDIMGKYPAFHVKQFKLVQNVTKLSKRHEEQKDSLYLCNKQTASSRNGGEGNFRWVRSGPNVWQVLGHSHVCRPGLACSDLPRKEGEDSQNWEGRWWCWDEDRQGLSLPSWRTCNSCCSGPASKCAPKERAQAPSQSQCRAAVTFLPPLRNAFLLLSTVEGAWASLLCGGNCGFCSGKPDGCRDVQVAGSSSTPRAKPKARTPTKQVEMWRQGGHVLPHESHRHTPFLQLIFNPLLSAARKLLRARGGLGKRGLHSFSSMANQGTCTASPKGLRCKHWQQNPCVCCFSKMTYVPGKPKHVVNICH